MRKISGLFLACTLVAMMIFASQIPAQGAPLGGDTAGNIPQITLKCGFGTNEASGYVQGIKRLSEKLGELSGGKISIETYPDGTLGPEVELIEFVSMGSLDMCVTSTSPMANYVQEFFTFDLPYLVTDLKAAHQIMDGPLGRSLLDKLLDIGIYGVALWDNGFRHFGSSSKKVTSLADLRGIKIRVMENELQQKLWTTLGAYATPMNFGEVITALQQGTIDAQENPLNVFVASGVYEVQKYVALTGHIYSPAVVSINKALWDSFSDEVKAVFNEAVAYASEWERNYIKDLDNSAIDFFEEKGLEVYEVDTTEWAAAVSSLYEEYADRVDSELVQALRD